MTTRELGFVEAVLLSPAAPSLSEHMWVFSALEQARSLCIEGGVSINARRVLVSETEMSDQNEARDAERLPFAAEYHLASGDYVGTTDAGRLTHFVRRALGVTPADRMLVVTDLEIMPLKGWRYAVWSEIPSAITQDKHGLVISIAPLDPEYWDARAGGERRLETMIRRLRSAVMRVLGAWLGLHVCGNKHCVMYDRVSSVVSLEMMGGVCKEHEKENSTLAGHRFDKAEAPASPHDGSTTRTRNAFGVTQ